MVQKSSAASNINLAFASSTTRDYRSYHTQQPPLALTPIRTLTPPSHAYIHRHEQTNTHLFSFNDPTSFTEHAHHVFHETTSTPFIIAAAVEQAQPLPPQQTFEAVAPDTNVLIGFGIVLILSVIASFVWANEVVPVSRTKLALSKRDGEVKEYLDGLREADGNGDSNGASAGDVSSNSDGITVGGDTPTDTVLAASNDTSDIANDNAVKGTKGDKERAFERWLFTDWLENNKSAGKGGRKKEPALPILKSAKWNSGDNPVLVTFAMMMVGVIIASVTERTGGSF